MKFCKDCKWYHPENWGTCETPKNGLMPTSGSPVFYAAAYARTTDKDEHGTYCGPTAKWFEEKEKPVPLCKYCKFMFGGYCEYELSVDPLTGFERWVGECRRAREIEDLCGKYGKWFEKKEERPKDVGCPMPPPKRRSWLCRLICGGRE